MGCGDCAVYVPIFRIGYSIVDRGRSRWRRPEGPSRGKPGLVSAVENAMVQVSNFGEEMVSRRPVWSLSYGMVLTCSTSFSIAWPTKRSLRVHGLCKGCPAARLVPSGHGHVVCDMRGKLNREVYAITFHDEPLNINGSFWHVWCCLGARDGVHTTVSMWGSLPITLCVGGILAVK